MEKSIKSFGYSDLFHTFVVDKLILLIMTNAEIDALCEWIDQNIGQYIGWNEWGSLRVVNPDRLKSVLKDKFWEVEFPL